MITVTTTQTRPSPNIPFFTDVAKAVGDGFKELVESTTLFAEQPIFELSPDGLVHTSVAKYATQADLDAFIAATEAAVPGFFASRAQFCTAYGITVERTVAES